MSKTSAGIPREAWLVALVLFLGSTGLVLWVWTSGYEHHSADRFLGPEECRKCHEEVYRSWEETQMARTFEVLKPGTALEAKRIAKLDPSRDYTQDETCLPCHTTGYGLAGGFRSFEETPEMAGVSCEACHGAGGSYVGTVMTRENPNFSTADARQAGLTYPPREEACRRCHNEKSPFVGTDYVFDYVERVQRGTHAHYPLRYRHDEASSTS